MLLQSQFALLAVGCPVGRRWLREGEVGWRNRPHPRLEAARPHALSAKGSRWPGRPPGSGETVVGLAGVADPVTQRATLLSLAPSELDVPGSANGCRTSPYTVGPRGTVMW